MILLEQEFKKVKVINHIPLWLDQNQIWLFHQLQNLPSSVESHIFCERTANLDYFSLPNIHNLSAGPKWKYFKDKGLRKIGIFRHLQSLGDIANREQSNILHSHFGHIGWEDLKLAKNLGICHVVTFYGWDISKLPKSEPRWRNRYKELFENVYLILCEGSHMAQCIINLGCPEQKVKVQHLGVDVDSIAFQPRVWNLGEPLKVLIAAGFREKKGIPYALEALGKLQSYVDLEITIIGDANKELRNQQEKQKILSIIREHNLAPKTRLLGYQPYKVLLEEAYKHHIFISSSVTASDGDTEGGAPVSLLDLAATGMPIVSTRHCDIPEVIHHGETGLLAEERNVLGLVNLFKWLINNPEQWHPMVTAGRKRVETEYNSYTQGQRLAKIYSDLL